MIQCLVQCLIQNNKSFSIKQYILKLCDLHQIIYENKQYSNPMNSVTETEWFIES